MMLQTPYMKEELWLPRDLPIDLLPGLLSKLPVKSLLRFRSVSKTWASTIENPKFVKSYKYRSERQIFVLHSDYDTLKLETRCTNTFGLNTIYSRPADRIIASLDGLFLFKKKNNRFLLWNPSIDRVRILPQTPLEVTWDVGIGYDPWIEDYKYVRVSYRSQVMVYTVGTNSWKMIPFKTKDDKPWRIFGRRSEVSVCFRGAIYFISVKLGPILEREMGLMSFDLLTEEFSFAKLPCTLRGGFDRPKLKSASDNSQMALFTTKGNIGGIWWAQVEGGDITWSKHYTFTLPSMYNWGPLNVFNIHLKVMSTYRDEVSMVLLLRVEDYVVLYDVQAKQYEVLNHSPYQLGTTFKCASSYVESLVLFN